MIYVRAGLLIISQSIHGIFIPTWTLLSLSIPRMLILMVDWEISGWRAFLSMQGYVTSRLSLKFEINCF